MLQKILKCQNHICQSQLCIIDYLPELRKARSFLLSSFLYEYSQSCKKKKKTTGNYFKWLFDRLFTCIKNSNNKNKKVYLGGIFHLADMLQEQFSLNSANWKIPQSY